MKKKITTRPSQDALFHHDVFRDGEKIGTVWFDRGKNESCGRITVNPKGELKLLSGATVWVGHFGWWADVKRELPYLIEQAETGF